MTRSEAKRWKDSPDARVREECERVLAARARRKAKSLPRRKAAGENKRRRAEAMAALRAACVARSEGKCEMCGGPNDPRFPPEMHHLLMGRGRRTQEQALSNCIMVCPACHMVGHRRILYAGPGLLEWAAKHGYTETAAVVQRRIDKALLIDPTWPRTEDEARRLGPAQHPHRSPEP